MIVPFIDLAAESRALREELNEAAARVLASGRFVLGAETSRLEETLAERVGTRFAVAVSSGTDALLCALRALDIGPGDRVVTTPYSFVASASTICRVGAEPIFVDIDLDTFNLDPDEVRACLRHHQGSKSGIKALLPVNLFGQVCAMPALRGIANEYGIAIIEDCAQAIDASFIVSDGATPLRAGSRADIACLSFYPTKNLGAAGDAGMVFTSRPDLADRLRSLRTQGADRDHGYTSLGGNFRMDELQAAVLRVKLPHLSEWTRRRRAIAARYDAGLAGLRHLITPTAMWGTEHHVYHQYVVRLPRRRDRTQNQLDAQGIETRVYYRRPLHHEACFAHLAVSPDAFPKARQAAEESLALPMHPYLADEAQARVITALRDEASR